MGVFEKIRGEFIDIIEWLDDSRDVMVYRFPRYQNEIKMGAKLVVRETQNEVFVKSLKTTRPSWLLLAPPKPAISSSSLPAPTR